MPQSFEDVKLLGAAAWTCGFFDPVFGDEDNRDANLEMWNQQQQELEQQRS